MRHKLLLGGSLALLLVLAACGGPAPLKAPDPPSQVTVTPGPNRLYIVWRQDGAGTTSYIVYRAPSGDPAGRAKLATVKRTPNQGPVYTYTDTTASNASKVLYSVAAVGPGGTSKATEESQQPAPPPSGGGATKCQVEKPIPGVDSDGDGIPDAIEKQGWQVKVYTGGASVNNLSGKWQQDSKTYTVKSDPNKADTDGDGLCDGQELVYRTDPTKADTDGDGLTDLAEIATWGSDPDNVDTDHDSFNPTITIENNVEKVTLTQGTSNKLLWDGSEVNTYHTSPTLADTDGDSYSDYNEIIVRGGNFNPLVANVPAIELSQTPDTSVDLTVNIGYTNTSKKAQTTTAGLTQGTSTSKTDTSSTTQKGWASVSATVSVSEKVSTEGASEKASFSLTAAGGYSHTKTTGWSDSSKQSSQKKYSDAATTASQQGRTINGGSIGITMDIHNPSDVSYKLTNLAVTALQRKVQPDGTVAFDPVATLSFDSALGGGITLGPGDTHTDVSVDTDVEAGNVILDLMADPSSLSFEVSNFDLTNESGMSYGFLQEVTDARTAYLTIDYANGDVVRAHVASNVNRSNGKIVGVTLKDALRDLGIQYKTATVTENGKTYTVLSQLYDNAAQKWVAVDTSHNKFWTTIVTGGKTAPLEQNFDDITLQPGSAAFLLFVQDQDHDGLFLRQEALLGTSDTNPDTDGDGLSDYFEARVGWDVKPPQPLPLYPVSPPRHVFSNPTMKDADQDGYTDAQECSKGAKDPYADIVPNAKPCTGAGTDPNNPDTDSDGLCDGPGSPLNTSGPCMAGATPDPKPLVPNTSQGGGGSGGGSGGATPNFLPRNANTSPHPYSFDSQSSDTIAADFGVPVTAASTFSVRSNLRGLLKGSLKLSNFSLSNSGHTLTFTLPNGKKWIPNEKLTVALNNIVAAASACTGTKPPVCVHANEKLPDYQYSFRAATNMAARFSTGVTHQSTLAWDYVSHSSLEHQENCCAVAGDFNQDGLVDLAFLRGTTSKFQVKDVVVVLQTSSGKWGQPALYSVTTPSGDKVGLIAGDFNNDGRLDLAVGGAGANGNEVAVLLAGTTTGTFVSAHYYSSGQAPTSYTPLATADFNGDGNLDLVVANGSSSSDSVLLGNGDGTFESPISVPSGAGTEGVATGDVDGDGIPDILTAFAGGVYVELSEGDGEFQGGAISQPFTATGPGSIATGDFNGDGWLDVVTLNGDYTVSLLLNDAKGDGAFKTTPNTAIASNTDPSTDPITIITADFDGSGGLDIGVALNNDGSKNRPIGEVLYGESKGQPDVFQPVTIKSYFYDFGLTAGMFGGSGNPLSLAFSGQEGGDPYYPQIGFVIPSPPSSP